VFLRVPERVLILGGSWSTIQPLATASKSGVDENPSAVHSGSDAGHGTARITGKSEVIPARPIRTTTSRLPTIRAVGDRLPFGEPS
jgi:hypothetical protein